MEKNEGTERYSGMACAEWAALAMKRVYVSIYLAQCKLESPSVHSAHAIPEYTISDEPHLDTACGTYRCSRDKGEQRRGILQCGDEGGGDGTGAVEGGGSVEEGDSEVACLKVVVRAESSWCTAP